MNNKEYLESLRVKPVSRCPFTGDVFELDVDTKGLQGQWWNYDKPIRNVLNYPKTFFAYDGAISLQGEVPKLDHVVKPGPQVPFVIPRLLKLPEIKAVLSGLMIGEHIAYLITYFSYPLRMFVPRINDWATNRYWESAQLIDFDIRPGQYISHSTEFEDYDYDLAKWIRRGKLLWIGFDDEDLRLRSSLNDCPYFNLTGQGLPQIIKKGQLSFDLGLPIIFEEEDDETVSQENETVSQENDQVLMTYHEGRSESFE